MKTSFWKKIFQQEKIWKIWSEKKYLKKNLKKHFWTKILKKMGWKKNLKKMSEKKLWNFFSKIKRSEKKFQKKSFPIKSEKYQYFWVVTMAGTDWTLTETTRLRRNKLLGKKMKKFSRHANNDWDEIGYFLFLNVLLFMFSTFYKQSPVQTFFIKMPLAH